MSTSSEDTPGERPPEILYHYTTQSGLLGIIKSKEIWATHFRHLNDTQEFELARRLFDSRLQDSKHQLADKLRNALKNVGHLENHQFLASFSEAPDSLPQWRAYAHSEPGYALGFDGASIQLPENFEMVKCLYELEEQIQAIDTLIAQILGDLEKEASSEVVTKATALYRLNEVALTIKDRHFKEEKEWRIVSHHLPDEPRFKDGDPKSNCPESPLAFRQGKSGIIPYRGISLKDSNGEFPLKQIVVGPNADLKRSVRSVRSLLENQGLDGVKVIPSGIPYRNW